MTERVQFTVSNEHADLLFGQQRKLSHRQWPRLTNDKATDWSRVALRIFAAYVGRRSAWLALRGRNRRELLPDIEEPVGGPAGVKVDVTLSAADAALDVFFFVKCQDDDTDVLHKQWGLRGGGGRYDASNLTVQTQIRTG